MFGFDYKVGLSPLNIVRPCYEFMSKFIPLPSISTLGETTQSIMEKANNLL